MVHFWATHVCWILHCLWGEIKGFLGWWLGLEKPGFYGDLGLFASIWDKNPVSGWVVGGSGIASFLAMAGIGLAITQKSSQSPELGAFPQSGGGLNPWRFFGLSDCFVLRNDRNGIRNDGSTL
ncbi:hypothetical protein C7B67_26715 [filamentous cyanobacterium Phorm 6]|nr:hypothetical protein C7B67_26715 [filamentous cyanobacterium Phorm 6]